MKQIGFLIVLMGALFTLFALAGCGEPEEGDVVEIDIREFPGTITVDLPIEWERGAVGGTWRSTFSTEIRSFNPFASLEGTAFDTLFTILDPLFDYDFDTTSWEGYLVEEFTVATDKEADTMELVCTLRDNIYWSDGVQMTADDVVFYFSELDGDPEISPRGYNGQLIVMDDGSKQQIRIEKVDRLTFKYIFPRIIGNPLLAVNSVILPKHIWEPVKRKGKDAVMNFWDVNTPPEELIGNGMDLLAEYKPAERIVYERNTNYWQVDEWGTGLPYIEKSVASFVPPGNPVASLLKFQQGEIESYGPRGQDMATLLPEAEEKGFDIWNGGPTYAFSGLVINQNKKTLPPYKFKIFSDKRFHHAVSALIDRETIVSEIYNGFAEPYYHFTADNNRYHNPQCATPYKYNPEQAREILAQMGLADSDGDGFLEDADGNVVSLQLMIYGQDQTMIDLYNIMIDEFNRAGIKAAMEIVDFNVWTERLQFSFEWECTTLGVTCPTFPEQYVNIWPSYGDRHYWHRGRQTPATEWEARIDELHERIVHTYDEEEIQKIYDEFQKIIMENMPMIPISRRYGFLAIYRKWGNINWDNKHSAGDDGAKIFLKDTTMLTN